MLIESNGQSKDLWPVASVSGPRLRASSGGAAPALPRARAEGRFHAEVKALLACGVFEHGLLLPCGSRCEVRRVGVECTLQAGVVVDLVVHVTALPVLPSTGASSADRIKGDGTGNLLPVLVEVVCAGPLTREKRVRLAATGLPVLVIETRELAVLHALDHPTARRRLETRLFADSGLRRWVVAPEHAGREPTFFADDVAAAF